MKTVRDILESIEIVREVVEGDTFTREETYILDKKEVDQALKEIEELILESLPEKLGMTGANAQDVENFGYNQALSDTKANLLKKLGGK